MNGTPAKRSMTGTGEPLVESDAEHDQSRRTTEVVTPPSPRRVAPAWRLWFELVLSLGLIAFSSRYLLNFAHSMADTSMWNDELFSATRFSGRGPIHTVTSYGEANNHIFFNLLNSLTPGAGSVEPLRARLWSFVAVGATAVLLLVEFFRRRWFLPGAVLFFLFATNEEWLDITLQARGYGILGLCALVSCVAIWRLLEESRSRWLVALAAVTLVGCWTVPTYVIWAGPVWLLLLLTVRDTRVLRFGASAFAGIVVVYLPVASQVRREMAGYAKRWGRHYTGLDDIYGTFKEFLFHRQLFFGQSFSKLAVAVIIVGVVLASQCLWIPNELRRLSLILVGATAIFFTIAVRLGTIVPRATAFVMVPFAFSLVVTLAALLHKVRSDVLRPILVTVVAVSLSAHSLTLVRDYSFLPLANWRDEATYVRQTFPDGTTLAGRRDVNGWRTVYLDSHYRSASGLNPFNPAHRWNVLVDVRKPGHPAFDMAVFVPVFSEIHIPQRRGDYQRIFGLPPITAGVDRVFVDGAPQNLVALTDHRPETGYTGARDGSSSIRVRADPARGVISRSLTMLGRRRLPGVVQVAVTLTGGGTKLLPDSRTTETGRTLSIALGDRRVQSVTVSFTPTNRSTPLTLSEVWIYPPVASRR